MDEKEKKKGQANSNTLFGISLGYIALAILAIPMLCGAVIGLFEAYDYIRMRQCFDEGEPLEWNGLLDFPAPERLAPITGANFHELSLLPYSPDAAIFSGLGSPISHPARDYFLSSNISESPKLILCQPDRWASHVLSYNVYDYRFSPDGALFAVMFSSFYEEIEIYDAVTIELLYTITAPQTTVVTPNSLFAFHPTEPWIAILVDEHESSSLYLWDYEREEEIASIVIDENSNPYPFYFLAFNEEGTLLIARRGNGQVKSTRVWGIPPE